MYQILQRKKMLISRYLDISKEQLALCKKGEFKQVENLWGEKYNLQMRISDLDGEILHNKHNTFDVGSSVKKLARSILETLNEIKKVEDEIYTELIKKKEEVSQSLGILHKGSRAIHTYQGRNNLNTSRRINKRL